MKSGYSMRRSRGKVGYCARQKKVWEGNDLNKTLVKGKMYGWLQITLDKPDVTSRSGLNSTTGTSNFTIQVSQMWENTALSWVIASSLMTAVSWPRNPDAWNTSIIREATQIEFHPDNINREEDFSLRKSWKPLIQTLNDCRKALSRHK
jgi:hypothetical protein